jgi:hypothetical protein
MSLARRTVLGVVVGALSAGCSASNDGDPGDGATPTEPVDQPACDPADVTRPPVASGTNIEGRNYPQKPETLSDQSILEYLDDFETSFAWNRVLQSAEGVTSLNVDNLDGFGSDETGDGFLASSGIRVSYSTEDGSSDEREYVANYFVAPGPVYRYESDGDPAAPEPGDEETALVQFGADD